MIKLRIIIIVFVSSWVSLMNAQLRINEFVSDNDNAYATVGGDYYDYIEIYNSSDNVISLDSFFLSDDKMELNKWKCPNIEILPHGFLVFFASGKDGNFDGQYHTNFKISADGEAFFLSNFQAIIDEAPFQELEEDVAFGRIPDGGPSWSILPAPSPDKSNASADKVTLSHDGGYYESSINLSVSSFLGNEIRYTVDGSIPTTNSLLYTNILILKNKSNEANVWAEIPTSPSQNLISNHAWESPGESIDKAHVLRFGAFNNDTLVSEVETRSYFVDPDIFGKYNFPIISLVTESKHLFNDTTGIYVPGDQFDISNSEWTGNYFLSGIESEKPVHIEYYQKDGDLGFSQNAGLRIHGGKTRHAAQKSLRLYARSRYGKKNFNYQLLPQKEVEKYKRFIIRSTMGAWGGELVFKDAYAQSIVRDLDFEMQDYRPVIVYLNGEYWGVQTIRDRVDEEFLAYSSGVNTDSVRIAEEWNTGFDGLKIYLEAHNPLDQDEYEYVSTKMDISSFIDYNITEMYLNNYDWPANNNQHWRPKGENGKWRWILYDLDATFGDPEYNMLKHNTVDDPLLNWPSNPGVTFLFRSLIANETFKNQFLARYKVLLENEFLPQNMIEQLDFFIEKYEKELPQHIERWHFPRDINGWNEDLDSNMKTFIFRRPCEVKKHIEDFFDIDFDFDCFVPPNTEVEEPQNYMLVTPTLMSDNFIVKGKTTNLLSADLVIYNSIGQVVIHMDQISLNNEEGLIVNVENLNSGVYFVYLLNNGETEVVRIVIVR